MSIKAIVSKSIFIIQGHRSAMDLENIYDVNFGESNDINDISRGTFDTKLMGTAENLSSKWAHLFKFTSPDEDTQNILHTIKTKGFNVNQANFVTQPRSCIVLNNESLLEKNNVIFLDEKYFKFGSHGESTELLRSTESTNSNLFSTVFDDFESRNVLNVDKPTIIHPTPSKKGQEKRKKKHPRNKPFAIDSAHNCSSNLPGAPPGTGSKNSRTIRQEISLTKNSNYSLQFRL